MSNAFTTRPVPAPTPQPSPYFDGAIFQQCIAEAGRRASARGADTLEILEAGCGRRWNLGAPSTMAVEVRLTGVDTDAESVRLRGENVGDLDTAIVADLRTVKLPSGHYDVVYCSWVLEHISGAVQVLDTLVRALRPGGYLLLRIPDRDSVYGFFTRIAPFALHVAYKRHIRRSPNAGKPGFGPFPTVYDPVVSFRGMVDYCARRNLEVAAVYSCNFHLDHFGRYAPVVDAGMRAIAALSCGRLTAEHSNLAFVLRKPERP